MRRFTFVCLALSLPVRAIAGPSDVPSFQYFYATPGADAIWSVACAPTATILAGGLGTLSVLSFSSDGDPLGSWPVGAAPEFVAVADDGTVWASSSSRDDVRSYTAAGSELVTIPGTHGALATAPGGDVFVGTTTSVRRYRANGAFVQEWPFCHGPNSCIGVNVRGLAVGADTTVYVALDNGGLEEVAWFRPAGGGGTLPWPYPYPGRAPRGVAIDPASGEVYVSFQDPVASAAGVVKY
jgi:hypothetical protein